jgi:hypothetical protein
LAFELTTGGAQQILEPLPEFTIMTLQRMVGRKQSNLPGKR